MDRWELLRAIEQAQTEYNRKAIEDSQKAYAENNPIAIWLHDPREGGVVMRIYTRKSYEQIRRHKKGYGWKDMHEGNV